MSCVILLKTIMFKVNKKLLKQSTNHCNDWQVHVQVRMSSNDVIWFKTQEENAETRQDLLIVSIL